MKYSNIRITVLAKDENIDKALIFYGNEGYQLMSVVRHPVSPPQQLMLFFSRAMEEE